MARAYVAGDLELSGVHPGDPYEALRAFAAWKVRRPPVGEIAGLLRELGWQAAAAARSHRPRRRRRAGSARCTACATRAAATPPRSARTTTCRTPSTRRCSARPWPTPARCSPRPTPRSRGPGGEVRPGLAQARPRARACGCSTSAAAGAAWRSTRPSTTASTSSAVTLSREQAEWGQRAVEREGLGDRGPHPALRLPRFARRPSTTRSARSGITEHIGVANYPSYFTYLHSKLRDGGRLLNHCITRPTNTESVHAGQVHRPLRVPRRRARPARAASSARPRTPASRCATRRTCASTTR